MEGVFVCLPGTTSSNCKEGNHQLPKSNGFQTSLQCLGAAAAVVASDIPDWQDAYQGGDVGGLLGAMLKPVGGFGKLLTVLLSLSVAGNNAGTFYSISLNLQIAAPALSKIPRNVFSVIATAM